jgi:dihydrofolate reductase
VCTVVLKVRIVSFLLDMSFKCSVFIATSLDGNIARADGTLDWLPGADTSSASDEDADESGYKEFMASVDVVVMGRHTWEFAAKLEPFPYTLPVYVLSHDITRVTIPPNLSNQVFAVDMSPQLVAFLATAGYKSAYIDGGQLISSFLNERLVDSMTITTIPILIGDGIRLFKRLTSDVKLKLVSSRRFGKDAQYLQNVFERK